MNIEFPWKSSKYTPFMGHITFELYDCVNFNTPSLYYVKIMVNEQEVQLPGQPVYCSYSYFWNILDEYLSASIDSICNKYRKYAKLNNPERKTESKTDPIIEFYVIIVFCVGLSIGIIGRPLFNSCIKKKKNIRLQ